MNSRKKILTCDLWIKIYILHQQGQVFLAVAHLFVWIQERRLGVTVTVESKLLWKKQKSHSEVYMRGVWTPQWRSTQITFPQFERTLQSVWFDAVMTPADKKWVKFGIPNHPFWGSSVTKNNPHKNPSFWCDVLKFRSCRRKTMPLRLFEAAFRAVLIGLLIHIIRGQRFGEVVCFTW